MVGRTRAARAADGCVCGGREQLSDSQQPARVRARARRRASWWASRDGVLSSGAVDEWWREPARWKRPCKAQGGQQRESSAACSVQRAAWERTASVRDEGWTCRVPSGLASSVWRSPASLCGLRWPGSSTCPVLSCPVLSTPCLLRMYVSICTLHKIRQPAAFAGHCQCAPWPPQQAPGPYSNMPTAHAHAHEAVSSTLRYAMAKGDGALPSPTPSQIARLDGIRARTVAIIAAPLRRLSDYTLHYPRPPTTRAAAAAAAAMAATTTATSTPTMGDTHTSYTTHTH